LAGGVAGAIWWWLIPQGHDPLTTVKTTVVFLLVAVVHVLVNFGTVAFGTSIARGQSIQEIARSMAGGWNFFFTIPILAAFIPLIGNQSLIGLVLFSSPLVISHFALNNLWQLRKDTQETLAALTDLLELRDPYTAFHSERVTDYAMVIAAHMSGFSAEDREILERASRIHDIGKVAVTDAILLKAGALTPDERNTMESHAPVGADLIAKMNVYHDCVDLIRHHHERWDGRGYPGKLSNVNIPLGARIMAVADSLDAMTTDRPYRKAMTLSAAIEEIQRNSGTQFDPQIVAAFMSSLHDPVFQTLQDRNHENLAAD
jgi:putative nucleotidyltransferase with HDIG domain